MKKIFSIIAILAVSLTVNAQSSNTRSTAYGTTDASSISFITKTVVDTAGATVDTVELRPNKYINYYKFNPVDSSTLRLKSLAGCYYGDQLILDIVQPNVSANFVYLYGNWVVATGTKKVSLTASRSTRIWFEFDGANWVERSRNANYTR